jgi:hypothetical protein
MAPEDNPADDHFPTDEEWEAYLQQLPERADDDTDEYEPELGGEA